MPADAGVDDRDAGRLDLLGQSHGLVPALRVVDEVEQRHPVHHDEVVADGLAYALDDLDREAHAVLGAAAPPVRTVVGARRQELVDQVALGAHDLDAVIAGPPRELGRVGEVRDGPVDLLGRHRLGLAHRRDRRRLGRRRALERVVAVAPGVQQLHRDLAVVLVHRVGDDPVLVGKTLRRHDRAERQQPAVPVGRVATGHRQRDATLGTLGEVGRELRQVLGPVLHAGVHRTHDHAVAQGRVAEVERLQQVGIGVIGSLRSSGPGLRPGSGRTGRPSPGRGRWRRTAAAPSR